MKENFQVVITPLVQTKWDHLLFRIKPPALLFLGEMCRISVKNINIYSGCLLLFEIKA